MRQRKWGTDYDTNNKTHGNNLEGRVFTNMDPPPQPPLKPEDSENQYAKRVSQINRKIEDLKEKVHVIWGLSSFGNIDFANMF